MCKRDRLFNGRSTRAFGPPVNRQLITAIQCNHWTYSLSLVVAAWHLQVCTALFDTNVGRLGP